MNIFNLLFVCIFTYFVPYNRKKLIQNNPINDLGYLLLSSIIIIILTLSYIFLFNKKVSTKVNYTDFPLVIYNCIVTIIQTLILYELSHNNKTELIITWTVMSLIVSVVLSIFFGLLQLTMSKLLGIIAIMFGITLINLK
jgi:uncharacterized membrane protein